MTSNEKKKKKNNKVWGNSTQRHAILYNQYGRVLELYVKQQLQAIFYFFDFFLAQNNLFKKLKQLPHKKKKQ